MKRSIVMMILVVGLAASFGYAGEEKETSPGMMGPGMGQGMMGPGMGQGMMSPGMGQGMMGPGMGQGMMGHGMGCGMMSPGMGQGMMGHGMGYGMMGHGMGYGMMGYGGCGMMGPGSMWGYDVARYQKFLDETTSLRRQLHEKMFDYHEAMRTPDRESETIEKLQREIQDLQGKIMKKAKE